MLKFMSSKEIDVLVRSYTNEQLLVNYREATKNPGTSAESWDKLLAAEVARRGLRV